MTCIPVLVREPSETGTESLYINLVKYLKLKICCYEFCSRLNGIFFRYIIRYIDHMYCSFLLKKLLNGIVHITKLIQLITRKVKTIENSVWPTRHPVDNVSNFINK